MTNGQAVMHYIQHKHGLTASVAYVTRARKS